MSIMMNAVKVITMTENEYRQIIAEVTELTYIRLSQEQKKKEAKDTKMTVPQLAKKYNYSETTVRRHIANFGNKTKGGQWRATEEAFENYFLPNKTSRT